MRSGTRRSALVAQPWKGGPFPQFVAPIPGASCRCKKALSGLQVEVVILPDGEQHKTLEVVSLIWDEALRKRLNRNCTFVALGGGVIGDMTGYAAASYQRGVNFIQVRQRRLFSSAVQRGLSGDRFSQVRLGRFWDYGVKEKS